MKAIPRMTPKIRELLTQHIEAKAADKARWENQHGKNGYETLLHIMGDLLDTSIEYVVPPKIRELAYRHNIDISSIDKNTISELYHDAESDSKALYDELEATRAATANTLKGEGWIVYSSCLMGQTSADHYHVDELVKRKFGPYVQCDSEWSALYIYCDDRVRVAVKEFVDELFAGETEIDSAASDTVFIPPQECIAA